MGIKINYKQFIRDREWFGFEYEINNMHPDTGWGYHIGRRDRRGFGYKARVAIAMWIIKWLNKWTLK